jgi:hypothetical protein
MLHAYPGDIEVRILGEELVVALQRQRCAGVHVLRLHGHIPWLHFCPFERLYGRRKLCVVPALRPTALSTSDSKPRFEGE